MTTAASPFEIQVSSNLPRQRYFIVKRSEHGHRTVLGSLHGYDTEQQATEAAEAKCAECEFPRYAHLHGGGWHKFAAAAEHVWDDNGVCQIHGDYCSMAPTSPEPADA